MRISVYKFEAVELALRLGLPYEKRSIRYVDLGLSSRSGGALAESRRLSFHRMAPFHRPLFGTPFSQ